MSRHFGSAARWQTVGEHDALGRKRKTHCKYGHKFDDGATWAVNWKGYKCRVCRECGRQRAQRNRADPAFKAMEAAKATRWRQSHSEEYRKSWQLAQEEKKQVLLTARLGGCIVCGEKDPACLDFHHRDPSQKEGHIGEFRRFGKQRLLDEIAKCDVLCANCHRKHHRDERQQKVSEGV